uniref:C3H1-type domain-containing protein n=1 Tax=Araucaria cunninghamii TaxID=56994 RepID=A0A0D6QZW4_ARACU
MESFEPMMKKPRGYDSGNGIGNGNGFQSWSSTAPVNTAMGMNAFPAVNPNPNPSSGPGVNFNPNPNPQGVSEIPSGMAAAAMGGGGGSYGAYENHAVDFVGGFQQQQGYNQNNNNNYGGGKNNSTLDLECRRYNTPEGCPYGLNCRFKHGPTDDRELSHQMPSLAGKTKPCMKFFSTSGCPYGESCHFLHYVPGGINALGLAPVQTVPSNVMPPPKKQAVPSADPSVSVPGFKTKLCNRFNTAEGCRFGDKCHFAHGESDLRTPNNPRQVNRSMPNEGPMQTASVVYNNGPPAAFPNSAGYGDAMAYGNAAAYSGNTFPTSQGYAEPTPPGVAGNASFVPNYNMAMEQPAQFAGAEGAAPAGPMSGTNVQQVY